MKRLMLVLLIFLIFIHAGQTQEIKRISKSELENILKNPSDKLHVINFWATWCGPCVTELPDFQKVVNESDKNKVDFLFVSLDFPSDADKKLVPFLKKNKYSFNVVLMTETDADSWIGKVDPNWQGSIPVTLFYNRARKIHHFVTEPMHKAELEKTIQSLLIN